MSDHLPAVYLAGPDVFQPDYAQHKQHIHQWCAQLGLRALCPGDDEVDGTDGLAVSKAIFEINVGMIEAADYVVANVRNFRGYEPDSGTVFEIGFAVGRGKKVWCYNAPTQSLREQVPQGAVPGHCRDGMLIEDFGLPRNLMIAHASVLVPDDLQACLQQVARWHAGQR